MPPVQQWILLPCMKCQPLQMIFQQLGRRCHLRWAEQQLPCRSRCTFIYRSAATSFVCNRYKQQGRQGERTCLLIITTYILEVCTCPHHMLMVSKYAGAHSGATASWLNHLLSGLTHWLIALGPMSGAPSVIPSGCCCLACTPPSLLLSSRSMTAATVLSCILRLR